MPEVWGDALFSLLNEAATVDLSSPPPGARYEGTTRGFVASVTTRNWVAAALIPFTCVWSGMSLWGMYGKQRINGTFNPVNSVGGIPFLIGSIMLVTMCLIYAAGSVRIARDGDDFEVFTGVGFIGWRRRYRWSEFRAVREDIIKPQFGKNAGPCIFLEGKRRAAFGGMLSAARRHFLLNVLRKELAAR